MDRNILKTIGQITQRGTSTQNRFSQRGNVNDNVQDDSAITSTFISCASSLFAHLSHVFYPSVRSFLQLSDEVRQDLIQCAVESTPDLLRMVDERLSVSGVSQTQTQPQNQNRVAA